EVAEISHDDQAIPGFEPIHQPGEPTAAIGAVVSEVDVAEHVVGQLTPRCPGRAQAASQGNPTGSADSRRGRRAGGTSRCGEADHCEATWIATRRPEPRTAPRAAATASSGR